MLDIWLLWRSFYTVGWPKIKYSIGGEYYSYFGISKDQTNLSKWESFNESGKSDPVVLGYVLHFKISYLFIIYFTKPRNDCFATSKSHQILRTEMIVATKLFSDFITFFIRMCWSNRLGLFAINFLHRLYQLYYIT